MILDMQKTTILIQPKAFYWSEQNRAFKKKLKMNQMLNK